jgi:hypothetical protein
MLHGMRRRTDTCSHADAPVHPHAQAAKAYDSAAVATYGNK